MDNPEANAFLIEQVTKIMDSINEDQPMTTLNETDLLIHTLDKEFQETHSEEIDALKAIIQNFLEDPKNNRALRMNTRIKQETETCIEYYDKDRGQDTRLFYEKNLESDLNKANTQIRRLLAKVIKEKLNEDVDLG